MADSLTVGMLRSVLALDDSSYQAGARRAFETNQRLKESTKGLGDQFTKLTPQAERMARSLGGDKLLHSANNLVQAVTKIGGATKLTAAEQAKANKLLTDAIAKYTALGQTAPAAMVKLEEATRKNTVALSSMVQGMSAAGKQSTDSLRLIAGMSQSGRTAMETMSKSTNELATGPLQFFKNQVGMTGAIIGSSLGTIGVTAVKGLARNISALATQGAKMEVTRDSFEKLAKSIGTTGDAMLDVTRNATRGLVNDLDLMLSVNKAILLGLPVTTDEMGDLAKVAVSLGNAMGLTATQALGDLITALGRSSPLILDNLGLTVDVTKANQVYATSLNKSANELSEAEKKQAFYNAAMEAARAKTNELSTETLTASQRVTQLGVAWDNFWANRGRDLASITGVVAAALTVPDAPRVDPKAGGGGETPAEMAARVTRELEASIAALKRQIPVPQMDKGGLAGVQVGPTKEEIDALEKRSEAILKAIKAQEEYRAAVAALHAEITGANAQMAAKQLQTMFVELPKAQQENVTIIREVLARYEDLRVKAGTGVAPVLEQLFVRFGTLTGETKNLARELLLLAPALDAVTDSVQAGLIPSRMGIEAAIEAAEFAAAANEKMRKLGMVSIDTSEMVRQNVTVSTERELTRMELMWQDFADHITFSVTNGFADMLTGLRGFKDSMVDIWRGIREAVANVISQMLADFIGGYLRKAVAAMAGTALAGATLGVGVSAASGVAAGGLGAAAGGGVGAGAGAAAGGGMGATLTGLATNPITWAVAAGLVTAWGIKSKGWFRGGEEGVKVNPRRDKFFGQFGPSGTGEGSGFMNAAKLLRSNQLFTALTRADTVEEWEAAQAAAVMRFRMLGHTGVKSYAMGGFVPPGKVQFAVLHGGAKGEHVIPGDKMVGSVTNNHYWTVQAWDGEDVKRVMRSHVIPELNSASQFNTGGYATEHRKGFGIGTR